MTDWIKTAKVGDKVVCLVSAEKFLPYEKVTCAGCVYTIREIGCDDEGPWLRFEEIVNLPEFYDEGFGELYFAYDKYRPVWPRNTDISWAHEILRKVSVEEPA